MKYILLFYFRFLAKLQLLKNKRAIIIGITGSAGKSSTRRALSLILTAKGKVKSSGSANSETGIPLNILGLKPINYSVFDWLRLIVLAPLKLIFFWEKYDFYVVEMAIDSPYPPKNMSYLLSILTPDIAIILNADLVHSQAFDSLVKDRSPQRRVKKIIKLISQEKFKLALGLKPTGIAIINADQEEFQLKINQLKVRKLTFGRFKLATLRFSKSSNTRSGFKLNFSYHQRDYQLQLQDNYATVYAYSFSSALLTAFTLGIRPQTALKLLANYRAPAGRMRLFSAINNSQVIDSSYNASPIAMNNALQLLKQLGKRRQRWAVLGDMRELGKEEKTAHQQLAQQIMQTSTQALLFGPLTQKYTLPILKTHNFPVKHFKKIAHLINYLVKNLPEKSYILVKASQNTLMLERVVASILANPQDERYLCRRGVYWDKIREKLD